MPNLFKPVENFISTRQEVSKIITLNGSSLSYTLCDRTDLASVESNYFTSFNLPAVVEDFLSGSTFAKSNPENYQLNVDKIIISPIARENYSETIDGRSITFAVPQDSASGLSAKTIVSSTYGSLQKSQSDSMLGSNIAFLFSDDINKPYTGTTESGSIDNAGNSTWNTTRFSDRPAAVSYQNVDAADVNSDQRNFSSVNLSVSVPEEYPTLTNQGYNYDVPVGFVALDKGFMVLTHPDIVDNFNFNKGQHVSTGDINTGIGSGTTDIYFSSSTESSVVYSDIDVVFKNSIICLAFPGEFNFSSNPTWDIQKNLDEKAAGTNNYDPIYVSEVGLYNTKQELVAIAKLDRPVKKTYTNLITFTIEIDV